MLTDAFAHFDVHPLFLCHLLDVCGRSFFPLLISALNTTVDNRDIAQTL